MAGDWRDVALEDVADELTVGYVGPMASEYVDEGIPFLRSLNVDPLRINKNGLKFITPEFHSRIRKSRLTPGDVVIVRTGKPGACSVVPEWLADANCSDLVIVRCGPQLDNRFLAYYVNTVACDHVAAHLVGAVQQHFNVGSARTLRLNLPPLAEQKAIAAVLGSLDDKIELNRRMNATLEAMARALFQSWFVDFDPVRAKLDGRQLTILDPSTAGLFPQHLEETALGHIPEGWQVTTVKSVVEGVYDGPHATPPEASEGPVFLGIKNLTGSSLDLFDIRHICEDEWPRWTRRVTPMHNDIVFSYEATLGFFALIPPRLRCCLGRRLALIRPYPKNGHAHFWFHQFIGPDFQRFLIQHSVQGATVDRIPLVHFPNYLVLNPPVEVKDAFEKRVAPIWGKIHANAEQSRTLATLRDTLLPKLLSGELIPSHSQPNQPAI